MKLYRQIQPFLLCYLYSVLFFVSCAPQIEMVSLGINEEYAIERMRLLHLHPEFTGESYLWTMKDSLGNDSVISTERDLFFVASKVGTYYIRLNIIDNTDPVEHNVKVVVWQEQVAYSRYITKVYEYRPAPGQFVNLLPEYKEGDTEESMCDKVLECIGDKNDVLISLGGYGGYVTFGFDHTVVNAPGEMDFKILGNSFYAEANPNPNAPESGGSSEPGIVMVALDRNGNGLPDDEWYELAGSEYHKPETAHNYTITYYRTPADHVATPIPQTPITDTSYIAWIASDGSTGYIEKNSYHRQEYFPQWIDSDEITFSGTRLAHNAIDESGIGSYYVLYAYDWGYADNFSAIDRLSNDENTNADPNANHFKISHAIDMDGQPIHLKYIDFVKVQVGVNSKSGWLGEVSTEVLGFYDYNMKKQ